MRAWGELTRVAGRIDRHVEAEVRGPEPGYVATPIIFAALAQCLLAERATVPRGVLTPGAAFYDSETVFDRLSRAGISFKVTHDSSAHK